MNRTIWVFRALALVILVAFALLMWNLHSRLRALEAQQQQQTTPAR
ncbi:MAG: hypothetical protein ACYC7A_12070 [Thermoanaerobaculia bacterium]